MTIAPKTRPARPHAAWAARLLLVLATVAALGGVVRNGFVNYDDDLYLTANPVLAEAPAGEALAWAFTTTRGGNWHPLTWVSHLADVRLFGLDPAAHHAVSLALHVACVLLLLGLLHGLTGALWPSALVAALFAIHPLHVESVAWAAERKDVLSTLFALGAALSYVRGVRRPGSGAPVIATPLLFALALLAKPMPLSLPLLLLLLDWWPLGRWSPGPPARGDGRFAGILPPARLWREKAPLLLLAAASAAVTWVVQADAGAMRASAGVPLPARFANAVVAYAAYLRKALWPQDLAVFYPYPWSGHPPAAVALALAALAALTILAAHQSRRRPWIAVGLLWYFGSLLPAIGLVQVGEQAMADRYTYLPLVGVFVAAAGSLAQFAGRGRRTTAALAAATLGALVALGAVTARQVGTWRDGVALFSNAVAATGGSHIAHNNLGAELLRRGDAAAALPHFLETARRAPASPKGYLNLGRALEALGRHEEAGGRFAEALARDPGDPAAHVHLARSLEKRGRREESLEVYRAALNLRPQDPHLLDQLGVALARAGRAGEAVPLLEAALALAPGNPAIREHLAVAKAQRASARGK